MICVAALGASLSSASSETLCFSSRKEVAIQNPHQKIFYTTVGKTQDHQDLKKAGPIGSKCWHVHEQWTKLPQVIYHSHLPKQDNYLSSQEYFWPVYPPAEKPNEYNRF
jgi:hypothetical protein